MRSALSGQDLKPCAVEGDEVHVDEAVAHDEIVVQRELEGGADPVHLPYVISA